MENPAIVFHQNTLWATTSLHTFFTQRSTKCIVSRATTAKDGLLVVFFVSLAQLRCCRLSSSSLQLLKLFPFTPQNFFLHSFVDAFLTAALGSSKNSVLDKSSTFHVTPRVVRRPSSFMVILVHFTTVFYSGAIPMFCAL